jgi:hypothetical protein
MNKRYWEVTVWDSAKQLEKFNILVGHITSEKLHELLRALTAKHALTDEETVKCFLKRNTKSYMPHLEIRKDINDSLRTMSYMCGTNPYCYARVVSQNVSRVPSDSAFKRIRKKRRTG